ncbi:ribonuclease M5 [Bacillus solimangrovi]|uniref:Ribonuclease M5 n=1 Tax=Bacillus solimangrovi TaxID=1305675 RepID=A0A1E5LEX1_9BACI|nr:ribonuclease M5 [Bacillus solimangrovi]OEH92622.1 ribonuclease M5 [Bacillus solimangrovi]
MKIKEIIVVEGKDDTVKIKHAVDADTIETNGSAINKATLEQIRLAQETRGVIVLTDPDYPGERIRRIISENVPGCKHAFLQKGQAIAKKGRGLGVEHASVADIRAALEGLREEMSEPVEQIKWQDLVQAGLIGGTQAKSRRERLGVLLKIGYTNGKQLHKRLKMFQITKQQYEQALQQVLQEEHV